MTIKEALSRATESLAKASSQSRRDAESLVRHVTGLSQAALLAFPEKCLAEVETAALFQLVERRAASEPIQYITGVQEFYGFAFRVTPAVLIPRPETEHLVEAAIRLAGTRSTPARILDVGTGSGAIAITLARLLPAAQLIATDISAAALEVARENAEDLGVAKRIEFVQCDLFPQDSRPFDLICSNPPYVEEGEVLEAQVADYEPHTALFAGPDGLDIYRRLIPMAAAALAPGGWLLLEIGQHQDAEVASLLAASHLRNINFVPDLQGIPRVAAAQK